MATKFGLGAEIQSPTGLSLPFALVLNPVSPLFPVPISDLILFSLVQWLAILDTIIVVGRGNGSPNATTLLLFLCLFLRLFIVVRFSIP